MLVRWAKIHQKLCKIQNSYNREIKVKKSCFSFGAKLAVRKKIEEKGGAEDEAETENTQLPTEESFLSTTPSALLTPGAVK